MSLNSMSKQLEGLGAAVATLLLVLAIVSFSNSDQLLVQAATSGRLVASPTTTTTTTTTATTEQSKSRQHYFGSYIGKLQLPGSSARLHNISGDVFAVDEQTLFIRRFTYDGLAPDAYFWSSVVAAQPSASDGFIVPDEKGSTKPLERYVSKDVVLRLPEGKTLREINWLSVWSRQRKENLAQILIERNLVMPRPLEIGSLLAAAAAAAGGGPTNTHGVRSGPITIVDAQTFLVPDLHYDGLAPDAYFWLTSGGQGLGPVGGLKLKDENGSQLPLRRYSGETVVISLPDELTIYDFDYFGLWCREFSVNFGQVRIPQQARVPPSPKMLGIKPENKLNCEILYDDLGYEIRWVLDGDDIVMQLVGKIEPSEYMAFGLGKDDSKSEMANADAVVAWVERQSGQVHAVDYFLGGKQQCPAAASDQGAAEILAAGTAASCPDARMPGGGDSLTLLHGAIVNGYSMVTFKRPQLGIDELYDQHVYSDGQQSVMWAIGQLNARKEVGYHRLRTRGNMFIDFARNPQWNCPIPDLNASMHSNLPVSASASQLDPTFAPDSTHSSSSSSSRQRPTVGSEPPVASSQQEQQQQQQGGAWFVPSIVCPQDRTFHAQIGPTGGKRGYEAITGRPSWGASWYINGLMIPELVLERGQSYRFIVEGGNDKTSAPRRHPLYLTDSQEGGFHFKTDEERLKERIYAGVALRGDGQYVPVAEGRLCEWRQTNQTLANPDLYQTFAAYQRTLKLECQPPNSGGGVGIQQAAVLKFSPDASTPDTLYYQCYTHRFMGWRIRVVDSCATYLASARSSSPSPNSNNKSRADLSASSSMRSEHRTYSRRNSYENPSELSATTNELLFANSDQTAADGSGLEFGSGNNAELLPLEADMLILNNSQLHQRQPYNLSNFDEVLKLSPADLEFLDNQQQQQFLPILANGNQNPVMPPQFALQLALLNQLVGTTEPTQSNHQLLQAKLQSANKTTTANKMPKTLQSYMRRLASIYYPVQQQLASMLSTQQQQNSSSISQQQQQQSQHLVQQPMASESAPSGFSSAAPNSIPNGFSLASLMPKPKIDLSKSTLSRKLNKLRFKSGRKLEPTNQQQASASNRPPRPANEFNYDIFNNQLAQLEKQQQQQLQSLDFGWQQQAQSEQSFQQQYPILAHTNGGFLMEPMTAEQLNFQSSILANSNNFFANQQQQKPRAQSHPAPSGNIYHQHQKQPARLELSFSFGGNRSKAQSQIKSPAPSTTEPSDEHAIFITRLPQPLAYAAQYPTPNSNWQSMEQARFPAMHLYQQQQQQQQRGVTYSDGLRQQHELSGGHLSSMPSLAQLTVHSDQQSSARQNGDNSLNSNELESELSGSDSGSTHDIRQQSPDQIRFMTQNGDSLSGGSSDTADHMLAIERFSKLPSERRPPSVVRPVTGEHVLYVDRTRSSAAAAANSSSPGRYSNLLHTNQPTAAANNQQLAEIMDTEQSVQYQSSDLQRLNSSSSSGGGGSNINKLAESRRTEPVQLHLVKQPDSSSSVLDHQQEPNNINRDSSTVKQPATVSTTSATILAMPPVTTEVASTQLSSPSIMIGSQQQVAETMFSNFGIGPSAQPMTPSPPLKSNLVEPIRSTLVQDSNLTPMMSASSAASGGSFVNAFNNPQISQLNFDSSPFTPIEFSPFYGQQPPRLRPPPLIESMYSSPERPEPPVQVASYLSRQLAAGHNPLKLYMANEKSNQMATSVTQSQQQQQQPTSHGTSQQTSSPMARQSASSSSTNDLIILKPSMLTRDNTYILKPEYIVNNNLQGASQAEDAHNLNSISEPQGSEASRRLVGVQFDRLSSLSSPPSTSIALDPLQTSHSVNSYDVEQMDSKGKPTAAADLSSGSKADNSSTPIAAPNRAQHRQTTIQLPLAAATGVLESAAPPSNAAEWPPRTSSGGFNSNAIASDNSTDNAILSHVMSLISSNAIPAPPLVPVASYSSADYFLPSGDRVYRSVRSQYSF